MASLVTQIPCVSAGLDKVKSKEWSQPLGLSLSVTGDILTLAGEAGLPVAGLLGTALKIGADMLSDEPTCSGHQEVVASNAEVKRIVQKSFKDISKKMDVLNNEIKEVKAVAYKTLDLTSGLRYKAGIEKIDAAYETLMDGANNLETTLGLFDNYIIELQTNAKQHLNPDKICEYLCQLKAQKEYGKCAAFFTYTIATRAKYLQMMSLYYIYKNDPQRVEREFSAFNADCVILARTLHQAIVTKLKPELVNVRKFSESLMNVEQKNDEQRAPEPKKILAPSMNKREAFNDITVKRIPVQVKEDDTRRKEKSNARENKPNERRKMEQTVLHTPMVDTRNRSPSPNVRELGMASSFFTEANKKFENMHLQGRPSRGNNSSSTSTSTSVLNGRKVSKTTRIENGKETVLTYENDALVKKSVNGIPEAI